MKDQKMACTHQRKMTVLICFIIVLMVLLIIHLNAAAETIYQNNSYINYDNTICGSYRDQHLICENEYKQTDIVFVFDSTGSMGEEVSAMKEVITDFADELKSSGIDYRLGLTEYKSFQYDKCGDEASFPYKIYNNGNLTPSVSSLKNWIENISAKGGIFESVLAAIKHSISDQNWRSTSKKIIILIGDEVPTPDGDVCNQENNTLNGIISELKKNSIIAYVIGTDKKCTQSNNNVCTDWEPNDSMVNIAQKTGGQFYNISSTNTIIPLLHEIKDALKCSFNIVPYASCEHESEQFDKIQVYVEAQLVGKNQKFIPFIENQMTVSAILYNSDGEKITEVALNPKSSTRYGDYYSKTIDIGQMKNNIEVRYLARICEWSETKAFQTDCISANVDWKWVYPHPQGNKVNAVWGTGTDNIYAVGNFGTVIHNDGISWRKINPFTLNHLYGVYCFSQKSIIVVGDNGAIFHFDGYHWKKISSPTQNNLYQVWGTSENNYYIAESSYLYHFDGAIWNQEDIPLAKINYISGLSDNTLYVGLNTGDVYVKNDGIWNSLSELESFHNDLWAYSKACLFAAGDNGIQHYDGNQWHNYLDIKNVKRITGIDQSNVYAITYEYIWFFDGDSWTKIQNIVDDHSFSDTAGKIWSCPPYHLYFSYFSDLLHYNGVDIEAIGSNPFHSFISADNFSFHRIWVSPEKNLFIAGASNSAGSVFQFDGKSWSKVQAGCQDSVQYSSGANFSIIGTSEDNVYMAGSCNQIFHFDGNSWNSIHSVDTMDLYYLFNDMWLSQDNTLYVNSYNGNILSLNSSLIQNINKPVTNSCCYGALWGTSEEDLYMINQDNIFHYDGQTWHRIRELSSSEQQFKSIDGISTENIVAISENDNSSSSIHSFDGNDWTQQEENEGLNRIWALNTPQKSQYFVVGNNGTIIQSTSKNEWSKMRSGTDLNLIDIHGNSIFDIHAIASESVLKYCPVMFSIDDITSASGTIFTASVRLKNSLKIPIEGINLKILFDNEMLQPQRVSLKGGVLEGKEYNFFHNVSGNKLNVGIAAIGTLDFYTGNGIIAHLSFKVIGNHHYSDITIEKAILNSDDVCSGFGRFYLKDPVSGKVVHYATKAPVQNVAVRMTGDKTYESVTNENGNYTFNGIDSGQYELIPSKSDDLDGIGAPDATIILKASVDDNLLSCHQKIAADVTQDNKVLAQDASRVANVAAGLTPCLNSQCVNWTFTPEEITQCDNWEWPQIIYPKNRLIHIPPQTTNNNFIAFRLGYVYHPPESIKRIAKQTVYNDNHIIFGNQGQILTIPIYLDQSTEIWGADITIEYDSSILTYKNTSLSEGILDQYDVLKNVNTSGMIKLVIYTDGELTTNSGSLAEISFEITSANGFGEIHLTQFDINKINLPGGFKIDETLSRKFLLLTGNYQNIDLDNNLLINLNDVIISLQVLSGMEIRFPVENDTIEIKDVIFMLQHISSLRRFQ